ncbi:DUF998 domain-containing protein, partial [Streptomyces sp. NPDC005904]|uniref:DUF998 domain-containing protein n=1 Tax=Streptomyces sp. NPDC005904 TaxID=3154570 RepID=UPI0033ED173D
MNSPSTTAAARMPPQRTGPPHDGPRRPAVAHAACSALLLGALLYTTWTVETLLPTRLSPLRTYVSELAATDQPYGTFFRSFDLLAGLLVLAGALSALGWLRCRGRAAAGWTGIALFG